MLRYFILLLFAAAPALAGDIATSNARAHAPIGQSGVGVGYVTFTNQQPQADAIVSAQSDAFERVELHDHLHENGVMKMRQVQRIALPAGAEVALKTGGLHLMLMKPTAPMKVGETLHIHFTLASGKTLQVPFKVTARKKTGSAHPHAHHGHH